ncbi:hypothetical protein A8G00_08690 [Sphingobium sp. SA916]|nr:hypothetical protein A8G00_08690 [Sphingobium sp. SA916]
MQAVLSLRTWAPGMILTLAIACGAILIEMLEAALTGKAWIEAIVLAILLGALFRTAWTPSPRFDAGIACASKTMLEIAVILMGATISFGGIAAVGLPLLTAIAATVAGAIPLSFLIGRLLKLPPKMALLVACGNAICGNSAIAAVAPVINAESDDVATSIAFTAVVGIVVVLALPVIAIWFSLSPVAGGVLAGLTVYAVPQVLAAASPLGLVAVQLGTLVKLVRVLMLGPVVMGLSVLMARRRVLEPKVGKHPSITRLVPPFILAFLVLAAANSIGAIPGVMNTPLHIASRFFTVLAMAGLGLGVDLRSVSTAGPKVACLVLMSLFIMVLMSFGVLHALGMY